MIEEKATLEHEVNQLKLSKRELTEQVTRKRQRVRDLKGAGEIQRRKLESIERLCKHHDDRANELEKNQEPLIKQIDRLKEEIKSLQQDASKHADAKETMDKELQRVKLEAVKQESVIEDLRSANDELQQVINVKSNFIQSVQGKSQKTQDYVEAIQRLSLFIAKQQRDSVLPDGTADVVRQALDRNMLDLLDKTEKKLG